MKGLVSSREVQPVIAKTNAPANTAQANQRPIILGMAMCALRSARTLGLDALADNPDGQPLPVGVWWMAGMFCPRAMPDAVHHMARWLSG